MSRQYQIPPDIKEKEKIIGGLFTKTQFVFVVAAVICGLGFGYLAFKFTSNAIVFFICLLIGAVPFLPFSFITIRKIKLSIVIPNAAKICLYLLFIKILWSLIIIL